MKVSRKYRTMRHLPVASKIINKYLIQSVHPTFSYALDFERKRYFSIPIREELRVMGYFEEEWVGNRHCIKGFTKSDCRRLSENFASSTLWAPLAQKFGHMSLTYYLDGWWSPLAPVSATCPSQMDWTDVNFYR